MNRDLRIVFMGTPHFAVSVLKKMLERNYNVVGVITAPDKPAGRGRKLNQSAVKEYAISQGLQVLQPTNLKSDEFIKELRSLNANLQVVVAFRMLPEVVWKMPEYGTFNLHASLLPNYRGAAPINWAIINGETTTGVSTFFIDEKIDTGEMSLQKEHSISPTDNAGDLHDALMNLGGDLVIDTLELIKNGNVVTTPQPQVSGIKTAYKLNKENCKIDWKAPIDHIYNKVRGLSPYPAAWSLLINNGQEINVKIYEVEKQKATHNLDVGCIEISKKEIKVAVQEGYILLKVVKLPGKKKMDVISLLNGYKLSSDAKMR